MHPLPGVFLECQYILFLSQLENLVLNWTMTPQPCTPYWLAPEIKDAAPKYERLAKFEPKH